MAFAAVFVRSWFPVFVSKAFSLVCMTFLLLTPAVHVTASAQQCPTSTPLARSRGYWGNNGQGQGSNPCPGDSCDTCTAPHPQYAALKSRCGKSTLKSCVQSGNTCWSQLAALLLDVKGCHPKTARVQANALFSSNRLRQVDSSCSYIPASSTITLEGLFQVSFATATANSKACNAAKGCLGAVLDVLNSSDGRGLLACKDPGTGWSDKPIFIGFNDARYEFQGQPGSVYTILSEQDLLLNAGMVGVDEVDKHRVGQRTTYMGAIGFKYHEDTVLVGAVHGDELAVTVNQVQATLIDLDTAAHYALPDGTKVKLWSRGRQVPDTVQVSTPKLTFTITATGHHLDFTIDRISSGLCGVHGVLGQTYSPSIDTSTAPAQATSNLRMAGKDADYRVSRLFASDSKFNTFGVPAPKRCGGRGGAGKKGVSVDVRRRQVGSVDDGGAAKPRIILLQQQQPAAVEQKRGGGNQARAARP